MPTRSSSTTRSPVTGDDDALDLPPLDDAGDDATAEADELDDDLVPADDGDAYDDATLGGQDDDLLEPAGIESGWLLDAEDAATLDLGGVDLDVGDEENVLGDDEAEGTAEEDPELETSHASHVGDSGEEGPLDEDEELREEDLPMLDADDEGDVEDAAFFEAGAMAAVEELLWADRAWERVPAPEQDDEPEDSSPLLPVPGLDPTFAARDARWKAFDEGARLTASVVLPGGNVIVALASVDGRARLVRIDDAGDARIIAEVEATSSDDEEHEVRSLDWDAAAGLLVASGPFGRHAFRPA